MGAGRERQESTYLQGSWLEQLQKMELSSTEVWKLQMEQIFGEEGRLGVQFGYITLTSKWGSQRAIGYTSLEFSREGWTGDIIWELGHR